MAKRELCQEIDRAELIGTLRKLGDLTDSMSDWTSPDEQSSWTWPLAAMTQMPAGILQDLLKSHPEQILVQEGLSIALHSWPSEQEKLVVNGTIGDQSKVTMDLELRGDDKIFARITTQLRIIPATLLTAQKPVPAPKIDGDELLKTSTSRPISRQTVAQFVETINDMNPLHTDERFARELGLPGIVVPGTLLTAWLQAACKNTASDTALLALSIRFLAPVPVGDAVTAILVSRGAQSARRRVFLVGADGFLLAIADLRFEQ